jgi:hypothetical protein
VHEIEQESQDVLGAPKELQGQRTETHELNSDRHILGRNGIQTDIHLFMN